MTNELKNYINEKSEIVTAYIKNYDMNFFKPQDLKAATISYPFRGGKRLRPIVLMLCAGIFGGKQAENAALPVACAAELFHNWTLIHDDIIDNDAFRRGEPTVHAAISASSKKYGISDSICEEYGRDIAILAGDRLHSWSIQMMCEMSRKNVIDPYVALQIISMAENEYVGKLVEGETLDIQNGLLYDTSVKSLEYFSQNEELIIEMIRGKTGILYAFCCAAGAMIGLNTNDENHPQIEALKKFAVDCGVAFQLQDDILGIVSDEKTLGKPIGSDIREGKKTTILTQTFRNASDDERKFIAEVVGDKNASAEKIEKIKTIFKKCGGLDYTAELSGKYVKSALESLEEIPDNEYKSLLFDWAEYMTQRKY